MTATKRTVSSGTTDSPTTSDDNKIVRITSTADAFTVTITAEATGSWADHVISVERDTTQTVSISPASGVTFEFPDGRSITNGETLDLVQSAIVTLIHQGSGSDTWTVQTETPSQHEPVNTVAASGTTETLDCEFTCHDVTLSDNCTFTFSGAISGSLSGFMVILRQDGTGSRTTTWPASVDWDSATAPTLSTGANEDDVLEFWTIDGGTIWMGSLVGVDFS